MQENRDCTEDLKRTIVDTESLSFGAALCWGLAGCLFWGALCDVTRAEGQSTLLLETSASSSNVSSSPSAPRSVEPVAAQPPDQVNFTGSVLFINFRSESADVVLPPQSPVQKLSRGFRDSIAPSAFIFTAAQAGISQADRKYPAFRQGAAGYGRYFWHDFADQASQKLLVESLLPVAFHDDNRYYRLGRGGFVHRTEYSLSRLVVTRDDRGQNTINLPEILGTGAAAGISSAYYPQQYRNWTETGQRWLTNAAFDGGVMVVREFWPEFSRTVFRRRR
jgi:hypothetical protein